MCCFWALKIVKIKDMRKYTLIVVIGAVFILAAMLLWQQATRSGVPQVVGTTNWSAESDTPGPPTAQSSPKEPKPSPQAQPSQEPDRAITVLSVPFTSQAPFADWNLPYQEACEEASMLMVAEYFKDNRNSRLDPAFADAEILKLVEWEAQYDYTVDVTAAEVVEILRDYYKLEARVVPYDPKVAREAIAARKPVIVPAAGRLLGNPNFRRPGPLYHMLVLKGYVGDEFITNDPGTRNGEHYRYHESVLAEAVHDWNSGDVEQGAQVMVVVSLGD